jgi:hypothetical protein
VLIFRRQRAEERIRIAVNARMRIGNFESEVTLLNAASRGVLAAVDNPPVRGTRVQLLVGEAVLSGTVRWHGTDCCGIALADPINVADMVEGEALRIANAPEPRGLRGKLRALVAEWN